MRGISNQQQTIIELLKERGENPRFGNLVYVWMSTREIVMAMRPDVESYLIEKRRYSRWIHGNMFGPHDEILRRYQEHLDNLKELPNYHTARTSINRSLRNLVKHGLVVRQPWWGMYARQGVKAGWLLPEYMNERLEPGPEFTHALKMAYDLEYRQAHKEDESEPIEIPINGYISMFLEGSSDTSRNSMLHVCGGKKDPKNSKRF